MTVPASKVRIVFPYDKSSKRYNTEAYSPSLTEGRAECEEIYPILQEIESIIQEKIGICSKHRTSFIFLSFVTWVLLLYVSLKQLDPYDIYFALKIVGVIFVSTQLCLIAVAFISHRHETQMKEVMTLCQGIIDTYKPKFDSVGLRWSLPPNFPKSIELWKDYKGKPGYVDQVSEKSEDLEETHEEINIGDEEEKNEYQLKYEPLAQAEENYSENPYKEEGKL